MSLIAPHYEEVAKEFPPDPRGVVSPYRVKSGVVGYCLTYEEYMSQLSEFDIGWYVPSTGEPAFWDDDWYERYIETFGHYCFKDGKLMKSAEESS